MENCFAVGLAGEAQNDTEDPGLFPATVARNNGSAGPKINLHFFAGCYLDPPDSLWIGLAHDTHKAFDRLIRAGELNLDFEILIDPLRR